ncbi:unnamed protein product [Sympodiomycopsis kandeliae]
MSMNLDKPLDDLISSKPRRGGRGGRRGRGGRASGGGAKAAAIGAKAGNAVAAAAATANRNKPLVIPGRTPGGNQGSKIIVSNLPLDVTEAQVKELFATTIGPLRKVTMSFRANGQSTGQVTVEFQRGEDAAKAYAQYNDRVIDEKKTLRVEEVIDPARAATLRNAQAAAVAAPAAAVAAATSTRGAARRGRGRGRGGRGGAARREQRPKKTAEDLDAEMEDYASNKTGDAAAAPAATS